MAEHFRTWGRYRRVIGDQQGITVAELLIASAVIGIALLALLQTIPNSAFGIQEGNQQSTAVFLANQRMEQVRNARWTAVPAADTLGVSTSTNVAPVSAGVTTFPDENPMSTPYAGYRRQVRISDCNVAPGCGGLQRPDMRQATVTVSYTPMTGVGVAATGGTKSVIISLIISERCFRATSASPCS